MRVDPGRVKCAPWPGVGIKLSTRWGKRMSESEGPVLCKISSLLMAMATIPAPDMRWLDTPISVRPLGKDILDLTNWVFALYSHGESGSSSDILDPYDFTFPGKFYRTHDLLPL